MRNKINNNKNIFFVFSRAQEYKIENDELHEQIKKADFEINDLAQINQVDYFIYIFIFKINFFF